ncbi:uncharacterized protein LOC128883390 [Hylaeus volcanicus]|uniref:uncharacterized protein LOC128883390 n=1 Tax=Hylaeus volcanicus TaxID=313075 RepID=UPI0023B7E64C|nr:uncharacterized protein LOC128883390 [Hylaeus volcanicus]
MKNNENDKNVSMELIGEKESNASFSKNSLDTVKETSFHDNSKTLDSHKWQDVINKSLKRTFAFFSGNVGINFSKLFSISQPHEKRQRVLLKYEFNISDSKSVFPKETVFESTSNVLDKKVTEDNSIVPVSQISRNSFSVALPRHVFKNDANNTESHARPVDALQHLVIRRPLKIPKAAKHLKWELMRVIAGHQGWVRALSVDPENQWFVSGGNDRLVKIWDLASGSLKLSMTGHINTIRALQVSHRHPYLFSAGEDQMVKCWDLEYNKVIRHYHGHLSGIYCMALHPSLDILATGGRDAVVRVWDMRTKLAVHVLSGHTGTVMSLCSQRNEPQFISGSLDKMIRCWDLVSGKTSVVLTHHKKGIRSLAIHPREYTFCSAAADHVKVWACPKGDFERNLETVGTILNGVTIRDENTSGIVIAGSDQGHLHFWDWQSGQKFQTIETIPQPGSLSGEKAIYAVQFDMSQTRLLTAECDKTIKVWREKKDTLLEDN